MMRWPRPADRPAGRRQHRIRSRWRLVAAVTGLCAVSVTAGVVAGSAARPPGEVLARSETPVPSRVTAAVRSGEITTTVVVRGDVEFAGSVVVRGYGGDDAVVTVPPAGPGTRLAEGDRVLEVAERPVFVLEGALPMYRDLTPGMTGKDVAQLAAAMARLGYLPRREDDGTGSAVFDTALTRALERFFADRDYPAAVPEPEAVARLAAAQAAVRAAAGPGPDGAAAPRSAVLEAEAHVRQAEAAVRIADAAAAETVQAAQLARDGAHRRLQSARADLAHADRRWEQAQQGTHPDTGATPTAAELAALAAERAEAADRVAAAEDDRDLAGAALARAELEAAAAADTARDALTVARSRLNEARAAAGGPGPASPDRPADLDLAEAELAAARVEAGPRALRSEFVFVPTTPAEVIGAPVTLGSPATEVLAELSGAAPVVSAAVTAADRRLVEVGAPALVEAAELGIAVDSTVAAVASQPGGDGLASHQYRVTLAPAGDVDADDWAALLGLNVKVTVPVASTGGEVLSVPAAALFTRADHTVGVEVEDVPDAPLRWVQVRPGLSADGYVEVTVVAGELAEGDRVVVGHLAADEPDG